MIVELYNLDSLYFICGMSFGYLVSIECIQIYMLNKSAYQLTYLMRLYIFLQILLNMYIVYGLHNIPYLPKNSNILVSNYYFLEIHYLSKYINFIDTIFMAFRKKNKYISFLHVYDHISVCFLWGLVSNLQYNNNIFGFIAFINSITDIIIYVHYLSASIGYKNPIKKFVSLSRIIQYMLFIFYSMIIIIWDTIFLKSIAFVQLIYSFHMLSLFGDFYLQNYYRKQEMLE